MQDRVTSGHFSRRRFAGGAGAAFTAIAAPGLIRIAVAQSWRSGNPFSLGVASGAPRPDGFVLWTRLAPEPLSTNPETPGGMSGADVTLRYEIATDPGMAKVVRHGAATAEQALAYSVHLDVTGLQAGRSYWYRFLSGDAVSATGRAITFPAAESAVGKMRFGFVSCSNYEHGYFSAYRHLISENPNSSCSSAIISTRQSSNTGRSFAAIAMASRRRRCPHIAIAMRNTGSTRTCKSYMRKWRPSSPGTITKCRTIMPISGRRLSTIRRSF